jgi:DNA-binding transcriptional LysR family regulator
MNHIVDMIDAQMDVALRAQSPTGSDYVFKKLVTNRPIFCASPEYLKKNKKPLKKIEDLRHHRLLMFRAYENQKILGTAYKLQDFTDARYISPSSGLFITELLLNGAGIGVRSGWDVHELLERGELIEVLKNQKIEKLNDIYLVVPSRRLLAPRVRAFIDYLSEQAKSWPE